MRQFVASKFDLRALIRTIANSEAYGLASGTVPGNERDTRLFSHHLPRPLTAHQMADALAQATDVPNRYSGRRSRRGGPSRFPTRRRPAHPRHVRRCSRAVGCGSTSAPTLTLRQALLLIGGDAIENKVTSLNGYLTSVIKLELEPEELIEHLYYRTVCRPPIAEELSHWTAKLKGASSLPKPLKTCSGRFSIRESSRSIIDRRFPVGARVSPARLASGSRMRFQFVKGVEGWREHQADSRAVGRAAETSSAGSWGFWG